jgi:mannitol/fructose-specific phosphotransferase system IIA component (Ntr-type)
MYLTDFISADSIHTQLRGASPIHLFEEVVDRWIESDRLLDSYREPALVALLKKEAAKTTRIAPGVALPHGRISHPIPSTGALVLNREGLDLGQGPPVQVVVVLLSPQDDSEMHLSALSAISRVLGNADLIQEIRRMTDPRAVFRHIQEYELDLDGGSDSELVTS